MLDRERPPASTIRFENIIPILRVTNLKASIEYYLEVLGFHVDWQEGGMAQVSRDGHGIMLCECSQGNPGTWVWIGVSDAALLFDEVRTKGATIRMAPTNFPWAYEMQVQDPDGHVLRFGSEPLEGEPFGEFVSSTPKA